MIAWKKLRHVLTSRSQVMPSQRFIKIVFSKVEEVTHLVHLAAILLCALETRLHLPMINTPD